MPLCECGCGQVARKRFVQYHILRVLNAEGRNRTFRKGERSHKWRGGVSTRADGYRNIHMPEHPNASNGRQVLEHVLVATQMLGRPLPKGAVVHHINGNPSDNRPENLIICKDHAEHKRLHRRQRALEECGNPNYLKCEYCKQYDDPQNMWVSKVRSSRAHHRACNAKAGREWRRRLKAQAQRGTKEEGTNHA